MLYGQKRSSQQRLYDDSNELRRPWIGADTYGGRLTYALDDGREIEVQRNFDRKNESVTVYDRTHGQDITNDFERLRNREPDFAEQHLGLSKAVFLNAATIGHLTLDDLGDEDALTQIRERILALADSSEETGSADLALKRLTERIGRIGRPAAHSKRPLPVAQTMLRELEDELRLTAARRSELLELEKRRVAILQERDEVALRRSALEKELEQIERQERAERLEEALRLKAGIDRTTQQCFALSAVRDFPLEANADVQRTANAVATIRAQVERTRKEREELHHQLREEKQRLGPLADQEFVEIPEETEAELARLESAISRLQERLEAIDREKQKAELRLAEARTDMQRLPDFAQVGSDPVEWLTQLAASFRMAQQVRDEERRKLAELQETTELLRLSLAEPTRVFSAFKDFPAESREHEVHARIFEEQHATMSARLNQLQTQAETSVERAPSVRFLVPALVLSIVFFAVVAWWYGNVLVYIPASLSALFLLICSTSWMLSRIAIQTAERELSIAQDDLRNLEDAWAERRHAMDKAVHDAGFASVRELEALYERYTRDLVELRSAEVRLRSQEVAVREEDDQVHKLYLRLRDTYAQLGEPIDEECNVQAAATRAVARYQEYRDAKRRVSESRDRPAELLEERKQLVDELSERRREEVELSLEVRRIMREAGYRDENRHTSALGALRAYRIRTAQSRQKRGRVDVLRERADSIDVRLTSEEEELTTLERTLKEQLAAGDAESFEAWQDLAAKAKNYRDTWQSRATLEEKLAVVLRGDSFDELQRRVEEDGSGLPKPSRDEDSVKADLRAITTEWEDLSQRAHDFHIQITRIAAGVRPLNEVEEEVAEVRARVVALEREMEAASYAAALIEEVARDRHARIAPAMANLAGSYLSEITGGLYSELLISRELRITIRIPQTESLNDDPERRLSKGTVDQIYLALRLALVRSLSEGGESIPLLLDDPFANYDDVRLRRALELLQRIGNSNQVLLFTCRDDVARSAEELAVPVLRL
jgi:DNA repair exonuclease SbcCD ATPase subunit